MNSPPNVPSANPEAAACKLVELATGIEPTKSITRSCSRLVPGVPEVRALQSGLPSEHCLSCTSLGLAITRAAVSLGIATTRLPAPLFPLGPPSAEVPRDECQEACRQLACVSSLPLLLIGLQVPLIG
jgi:hypothetical protein